MGCIVATKQATPLVVAGNGGAEKLMGVLLYAVYVQANGVDFDRWFGFILVGGNVKTKSLIESVGGSTPGSWIGGANEVTIRALLDTHFVLDDQWYV